MFSTPLLIRHLWQLKTAVCCSIDQNKPACFKDLLAASIDIKSLQNRMLKVCYVPATSTGLPRVSFFFSFFVLLLQPLTVLMKQTRQAVRAIKRSILLDVYGSK
jgi:hypothetical protein